MFLWSLVAWSLVLSPMLPTLSLLNCCLAWALLGVAASWWKFLQPVWIWVGLLGAAAAIGDAVWLWMMKRMQVERRLDARMALGVEQEMTVTLRNPDVQPVRVRVLDGLPAALRSDDWPWQGRVPGR